MDDRTLMEDLLLVVKGACDLYVHGAIESSSPLVQNAFNEALNETLCVQTETYQKMVEKGWYQVQPVEVTKVKQVYDKFTCQM